MRAHVHDPHVRRAQQLGYRSRAAFKLLEIDRRDRLLRPGMRVADLGAAPGSWSQVAAAAVAPGGVVVAVDCLPFAPIPGVITIQGDLYEPAVRAQLVQALNGAADLVLSDMAPNLSGVESADRARAAELAGVALEFARTTLKPGGGLLVKLFQSEEAREFVAELWGVFQQVQTRKPEASRSRSSEFYVFARGLLGDEII